MSNKKEYNILIYVLILTAFWQISFIPKSDILIFIATWPLIWLAICNKNKSLIFKKIILLLFCLLAINAVSCYFFRGQSLYHSFRSSYVMNFFPLLFYFYLIKKKASIKTVENVLCKIYLIFSFCFILQYIFFPKEIFILYSPTLDERRFRLYGQAIMSLGFFYYTNKFIVEKKISQCVFAVIGLIQIFLLGFRSLTLAALLVSFLLIGRIQKFKYSKIIPYIFLAFCIIAILLQFDFTKNIIEAMINRNEDQNFSNEDYIRVRQFNYFTTEHFKNSLEYFLGSGFPNMESHYGKYMKSLQIHNQYGEMVGSVGGWVDWGIIGLSWVGGIPLSILLIFIGIKAVMCRVTKEYLYISSFYIFLLLGSITTTELYREGAFVFHAIALYILELVTIRKNQKKSKYNLVTSKIIKYNNENRDINTTTKK